MLYSTTLLDFSPFRHPTGYVEDGASPSMQKRQWEVLEMTEEALRLLATHACLGGDDRPGAARPVSLLLAQAVRVTKWHCLRKCDESEIASLLDSSVDAAAASSASESLSAGRCSQLLRLISLALTSAKLAAVSLPSWEVRQWDCCFQLLQECTYAAQGLGVPQHMAAARGAMALLLQPACEASVLIARSPGVSVKAVLAGLHGILECSCTGVPPRTCLEAVLSAPVWSVVEEEAEQLEQHSLGSMSPCPDKAVEAGQPSPLGGQPYLDDVAASLADFLSLITDNLVSYVLSLPVISSEAQRSAMLQRWQGMAATYFASCTNVNEGDGGARTEVTEPNFSTTVRLILLGASAPGGGLGPSEASDAPAPLSEEMASSAVSVLSRVLCSPVWDRLLSCPPLSSGVRRNYAVCVLFVLLQAAAVLELHPALQNNGLLGPNIPGGMENHDDAAAGTCNWNSGEGDVGDICETSSGGGGSTASGSGGSDVGVVLTSSLPASRPPPLAVWKIARHGIAGLLTTDDLFSSFSIATAHLREVLADVAACHGGAAESGSVDAAGGGSVSASAVQQVSGSCLGAGALIGSRDWECVQCELLLGLPEELWGVRPCCNTACVRLEGPCEMEVKTRACGGGCGARYCCAACQEQAWWGGHRRNCAVMREMREQWDRDKAIDAV